MGGSASDGACGELPRFELQFIKEWLKISVFFFSERLDYDIECEAVCVLLTICYSGVIRSRPLVTVAGLTSIVVGQPAGTWPDVLVAYGQWLRQ